MSSHSGGFPDWDQRTKYSINLHEFQHGEDYLNQTFNIYGELGTGIFYAQINATTLFTIDGTMGAQIHVYDLSSMSSASGFRELTDIPQPVNHTACLASSDSPIPQLYITGGTWTVDSTMPNKPLDVFQIFTLDNNSWSTGRNMHFARHSHGCIVMNDTLWVMGYIAAIETIDTTDLYHANWSVNDDLRIDNRTEFGMVAVDDLIYIVGGQFPCYCTTNMVYIIDTISNNITTSFLPSDQGIAGLSMVAVDGTIYGFGGYYIAEYARGITNEWMLYGELSGS